MSTWLCSSGEERALVSGLRESEFWSFAKGLRDRGAARGFRGQPKSTLGLPFTWDKLINDAFHVKINWLKMPLTCCCKLIKESPLTCFKFRTWLCRFNVTTDGFAFSPSALSSFWSSIVTPLAWLLANPRAHVNVFGITNTLIHNQQYQQYPAFIQCFLFLKVYLFALLFEFFHLTLLGPGGGTLWLPCYIFAYNRANTRTSVLKNLDFSQLWVWKRAVRFLPHRIISFRKK